MVLLWKSHNSSFMYYKQSGFLSRFFLGPALVLLLSSGCVTHLCGSNTIQQVMSFEF